MSISVACAACGKAYKLDDRFAGKRVKCNRCGSTFSVPAEAPVPAEIVAPVAPAASRLPDAPSPAADDFTAGPGAADDSGSSDQRESQRPAEQSNGSAMFEPADDGLGASPADVAHASAMSEPPDKEFEREEADDTELRYTPPGPATPSPVKTRERLARRPLAERPAALPSPSAVLPSPAAVLPSPAAVLPSPAAALAATRTPLQPRRGGRLLDLIAMGLYVVGIAVEIFGWSQVAAVEFYGRRIEHLGGDEGAALRLLRLQVRGGMFVIAGLLILILAALIHVRAAFGQGRAEPE